MGMDHLAVLSPELPQVATGTEPHDMMMTTSESEKNKTGEAC